MVFLKSDQKHTVADMCIGIAIFLCSALALIVESGYSYGPALLCLGSVSLLIYRPKISITKNDWRFIALLAIYFVVHVLFNIFFALPARSYDGISRFLLVIPVYFLLIYYAPKPIYLWSGLMIGALGSGTLAVYQKFYLVPSLDRANGYINAIQFGDISFLIASLLLCGFVWAKYTYKTFLIPSLFLLSSFAGFLASFLSLSRGGWLAIPFVLFILFKALNVQTRKILASFALISVIFTVAVISLPDANFFKQRLMETKSDISSVLNINASQESMSFNTRLQMWNIGINAFYDRPITGWGSITAIKLQYPEQWRPLDAIDDFNHLHNEYIDTLAKRGLLGFAMLMLIYLFPLIIFIKLMCCKDRRLVSFAASGAMLILCVMVFGLTQTFMAHISGITIFPFFLVIIAAYTRNLLLQTSSEQNK